MRGDDASTVAITLYFIARSCSGDWIQNHGNGIVAVFTIILGVATWLLWRATRALVLDGRDIGTKQVEVAQAAAEAARRSADIAKESLIVAQRAYVVLQGIKPTPIIVDGKFTAFRVSAVWRNSGNTSAYVFARANADKFTPCGIPDGFEYPEGPDKSGDTSAVAGEDPQIAAIAGRPPNIVLTIHRHHNGEENFCLKLTCP